MSYKTKAKWVPKFQTNKGKKRREERPCKQFSAKTLTVQGKIVSKKPCTSHAARVPTYRKWNTSRVSLPYKIVGQRSPHDTSKSTCSDPYRSHVKAPLPAKIFDNQKRKLRCHSTQLPVESPNFLNLNCTSHNRPVGWERRNHQQHKNRLSV